MRKENNYIRWFATILVLIAIYFPSPISHLPSAFAADEVSEESHKIPRFVSIRAKEINLRTGPGERYPIDWVIKDGKGWPLEVIQEFDNWRRVKEYDGTTGWVHRAMLSKKQSVVVTKDNAVLRNSPGKDAAARARIQVGTHGVLKKCEGNWCDIEFDGGKGWLPTAAIWGEDVTAVP